MIKSYKGLIDHRTQQRIRLGTPQGKVGYRIRKFQLFPKFVGSSTTGNEYESLVNIYKVEQTVVSGITTDFTDTTLVAAGTFFSEVSGSPAYVIGSNLNVVFDNETFNQDIYVVHENYHNDDSAINYYIELEQVKLTEEQALVAIVKNLRTEQ